jgi:hypothetical protein
MDVGGKAVPASKQCARLARDYVRGLDARWTPRLDALRQAVAA